ncbi:MAG TPA: hypothetical protein VLJ57_12560 [Burkholderiaceae bacterium]|nr:hypothetical protein [Burkholderiaceae bacterium]
MIDRLQDRSTIPNKYRASFRRVHAAVIAQKELHAKAQLKVGQSLARIGHRHVRTFGRLGKASPFSAKNDQPNGDEVEPRQIPAR